MAKKALPSAAQRKVLDAARGGKLAQRFGIRSCWWEINGQKVSTAPVGACVRAGWVDADPITSTHNRIRPWLLTPLGLSALQQIERRGQGE